MSIDKRTSGRSSTTKSTVPRHQAPTKGHSKVKRKQKKKKRTALGTFKKIFLTFLFIMLTLIVIGAGYVFAVLKSTPPLDVEAVKNLSQPSSLYDKNGVYMDTVHSQIDRTVVGYDEIPANLKNAFISIEDQRFESHIGIDPIRIAGSFITDITKIFRGQTGMHGGSTITQQLLKNTILTDVDFVVERKIKELYLAIELENELSKDEILNQYLNTIPVGGTSYGVEAGANLYFGKPVKDLNLIECAYIAGITQAPTYYSAYNENNKKNPAPYINRTKTVLSKMKELGKITDEEYVKAISDIDAGKLTFHSAQKSYTLNYEWYINPAIAQVKEDLQKKYKYSDEEVTKLLANGGLKINTNMDRDLQDYTQQILNNYKANNVGYKEEYLEGTKTPAFQASATIVDYKTGKVLAMIGGRGEHGAQSMNRAYNTLRPIGSTIKPLAVYGPAINEKVLTAASIIKDAPIENTIGKTMNQGKPWALQNDDHSFSGDITLREGLNRSKNVVSAIVTNTIGLKTSIAYGEKFGLVYNDVSRSSYAAAALGQFDNNGDGGNTFITSSAFGVFANNGNYTTPKLYSKVYDASGNVLLDSESNIETKQIFSKEAAYIMYDILKGCVENTGPSAKWGSMPVAGKTGTTSSSNDLWFTGVTPYLSGSIWLGFDTPKKLHAISDSAADLWGKIMKKAHEGLEVTDINMPEDIVTETVCKSSGKLATSSCHSSGTAYEEMFVPGTEPSSYCTEHAFSSKNTQKTTDNSLNENSNQNNEKPEENTVPDPSIPAPVDPTDTPSSSGTTTTPDNNTTNNATTPPTNGGSSPHTDNNGGNDHNTGNTPKKP